MMYDMGYHIVSLRSKHIDAIHSLQLDSYRPEFHEEKSTFLHIVCGSPDLCFVAFEDHETGTPIGYILAHSCKVGIIPALNTVPPLDANSRECWVHDLCVKDSARGAGIGAALCRTLVSAARWGCYKTIRGVSVQGTEEFWKKQGFEPMEAHKDGNIGYSGGTPIILSLMH
jgi:predicted N-acetyltransferase YhbS